MGIVNKKEKVRDGYLGDLPEDLQSKVMNIHKLIKNTIHDLLDDPNYEDLKESSWAMSCIDEFCVMPKDKGEVGSIRVYKNGKTYRCMIQATGHFRNHQYGWIEELLHDFIGNVFATIRPKIRRKYDMTITNEGRTGQPYEGFDIYPNPKVVRDIWDSLNDRKTKTVTESITSVEESMNISEDLMNYYEFYNKISYDEYFYEKSHGKLKYDFRKVFDWNTGNALKIVYSLDDINIKDIGNGYLGLNDNDENRKNAIRDIQKNITKKGNMDHLSSGQKILAIIDRVTGKRLNSATAIGPFAPAVRNERLSLYNLDDLHKYYNKKGKEFTDKYVKTYNVGDIDDSESFKSSHWFKKSEGINDFNKKIDSSSTIAQSAESLKYGRGAKINDIEHSKSFVTIGDPVKYKHPSKRDINKNPDLYKKESASSPEYNVDMSESVARRTLRTLSQSIINDIENKKNYKVAQYTANIYANIITKNLLPLWAKGFRKVSITLDSYQSFNTFEFKVPNMSQDFVSRFINGRESISGFIHRQPEIRIKMSPRIFHTMENADDAFRFFKAAIKYYDTGLEKAGIKMMAEAMKMNHEMKHLVSTTKLSGLIVYPLSLLFHFDNVQMNNVDTFRITKEDISTVNNFIKNIYTRYAAPEKERKQIIEDVKEMVRVLRECGDIDDNITQLQYLPESVEKYLFGEFDSIMKEAHEEWIQEQFDIEWNRNPNSYNIKYLQEKFGVKKLKKIPSDLVPYIQIETESIKDSNDKMMISSYCLGKIEIVEWYIELLEVGSKKYIVPHTKPYLETLRTQLLACFKKIMDTPIPKKDRPLIDIQYPKGYEG